MALYVLIALTTTVLEWTPTGSTVSVLTRMKKEYGLNQDLARDLVDDFKDARANGNLDEFGQFLETVLTKSQLKQLHSYSFQYSLGNGLLSRALRLNRVELTEIQQLVIKEAQAKCLERARLHDIDDCHAIGEWILSPIISSSQLRLLEGEKVKWLSKRRMLTSVVPIYDTTVDGEAIDVINWPEIAAELQLTPAQMRKTQQLKKPFIDLDYGDEDEFDLLFYDVPNGKTPAEVSRDICRDVTAVLNEKQLSRFNQILLQRYVAVCPPFAVPHLRRMGHAVNGNELSLKKRYQEYDNSVYAIRHFRRLHYLLPVVKEFMDEKLADQLMKPRFIPVKDGKKPNMEASIFSTVTGQQKRKTNNPRRER